MRPFLGLAEPAAGRGAYTTLELVVVLFVAAIVLAIALPRGTAVLDRIAVHAAAGDLAATLHSARALALAGRAPVAVDVDAGAGTLRVRRGPETILSRNIAQAHGVALSSTRDSLTYGPLGLGRGAANLSIVVRRRTAVETVFVSRLGRIR